MFDPGKIQDTLNSLRSNATSIRNAENLGDVQPQVLELLLLRAHADLTSCAQMLQQLADERDGLQARVDELTQPPELPQEPPSDG